MWRVWALLLVSAVLGAEEFLQGDDAEDLERRLDDLRVLGEVQVRWRVRGAAREWERLHWYQRVEWEPRMGQDFFAVVERDPGERRLYDFNAFYYGAQMGKGRVVVGDFRPGFGTGMVFGRRSRGGVPSMVPAEDSRRLGYRSSGENESLRGVVGRYGRGSWEGVLLGGRARRDGRLDEYERVSALPASGYHVTETEIAGRDLLGIDVGGARLHWRGERWQWGGQCWVWNFRIRSICGAMGGHPGALWGEGNGSERWICGLMPTGGMECLKWRGTIGGIGVSWERLGFEQGVCESGRSDATMLLDSTVFSAGRPEPRG